DDIDALDVDAGPFVDDVGNIDGARHRIPVEARLHLGEGITLLRGGDGQGLGRLLHPLYVVGASGATQDDAAQRVDIDRGQRRLHVDHAEFVLLALINGEGDEETAAVTVEVGGG